MLALSKINLKYAFCIRYLTHSVNYGLESTLLRFHSHIIKTNFTNIKLNKNINK